MRSHPFTTPLAALALSHLLGCSWVTDPQNGGRADNRGLLVASYPTVSGLTWSTDGTELFFIEGNLRIRATAATGGSPRTLYSSDIPIRHIGAAANKLYVSVSDGANSPIHRILRIHPTNLAVDTVLAYAGQVRSLFFSVSRDGRFVAFGDSLFDLVAATRVALPLGQPFSFSPDGSQLLYRLYELSYCGICRPSWITLIATADASSQNLNTPGDIAQGNSTAFGDELGLDVHYWTGNDPKVLRLNSNGEENTLKAFAFDLRTAANTEIASVSGDISSHRARTAISTDGKRAAIWIGPASHWSELHVIDTETLSRNIVARVSGDTWTKVYSVVLSPDGSRVAYAVCEGCTYDSSGAAKVYVVTPD